VEAVVTDVDGPTSKQYRRSAALPYSALKRTGLRAATERDNVGQTRAGRRDQVHAFR
jgi:hypothetical protein